MKIAIAQTRPIKGDISANIEQHGICANVGLTFFKCPTIANT
ncbi:MAG: hypothetical protein ACK5YT_02740 [Bacteroidota bacterium]